MGKGPSAAMFDNSEDALTTLYKVMEELDHLDFTGLLPLISRYARSGEATST